MFTVERTAGEPLDTWVLSDTTAGSRVEVAPARGGMVTRFVAQGREVLFMDAESLSDLTKNVRGGIPVLFPIAGRLPDDTYRADGRAYTLKQHGFARNRAWTVDATASTDAAAITLSLTDDPATRAVFPYAFRVTITYALAGDTLTVTTEVTATGETAVPVHLGFHPYFRVADASKRGAAVRTDATRAWDNRTHTEGPFGGWDLTAPEVDLHLLDHHLRGTALTTHEGTQVAIDTDTAYGTLVVWTLAGRDFVCVEPWTAPGGALATGHGLVTVPVGHPWRTRWGITAPSAT